MFSILIIEPNAAFWRPKFLAKSRLATSSRGCQPSLYYYDLANVRLKSGV